MNPAPGSVQIWTESCLIRHNSSLFRHVSCRIQPENTRKPDAGFRVGKLRTKILPIPNISLSWKQKDYNDNIRTRLEPGETNRKNSIGFSSNSQEVSYNPTSTSPSSRPEREQCQVITNWKGERHLLNETAFKNIHDAKRAQTAELSSTLGL